MDLVYVVAHRKAVGVLVPVRVYDELRGEREQADLAHLQEFHRQVFGAISLRRACSPG
jgi:fido (protein-threonine AMPylation protein)